MNSYYESTRIRQKSTENEKATTGYFPWKKLKVNCSKTLEKIINLTNHWNEQQL